jgi:sec-independent protein translocase protein TatB
MFDIGFAELIIIGVVALLVIGPERLPGTIRTASLYINRIRRGFNEIKQEVQQELHNDAVMQELRQAGEQLKQGTESLGGEIREVGDSVRDATSTTAGEGNKDAAQTGPGEPLEKKAE